MIQRKLLVLPVFLCIALSGCVTPQPPPIFNFCSLFPLDPTCICPAETNKVQDNIPIPELVDSTPFYCVDKSAVIDFVWKIQVLGISASADGYRCTRTTSDSPFAHNYPYVSNQDCLSALSAQTINYCPLESELGWVAIPNGDKVVCNDDRHYHVCSVGSWVVDETLDVRTTGASYCPGGE